MPYFNNSELDASLCITVFHSLKLQTEGIFSVCVCVCVCVCGCVCVCLCVCVCVCVDEVFI